ncbi:MAG: DUF192 domain-containing protein [Alphaproteobacteria bacterium]|nr:DUF192 domain-containing protein [Alphaproteobacteria bacterium]
MTKGLLCGLLLLTQSVMAEPLIIKMPHTGEKHLFNVEVSDTPQKSEKGLMFRFHLPDDSGMIFIEKKDKKWGMWMKNTYIPLDMLFFMRNGQIVQIIENAIPHDLTPLWSIVPVAGVVEIKGGTVKKLGIKEGDILLSPQLNNMPTQPVK